jgi:hypothetical protein
MIAGVVVGLLVTIQRATGNVRPRLAGPPEKIGSV